MPIKLLKEKVKKINGNVWKSQSRQIIFHGEVKKFGKAFRINFVTLMISSLGLLVALTWNNFWNSWVTTLSVEQAPIYKFYFATAMTILAVMFTYILSRVKGE